MPDLELEMIDEKEWDRFEHIAQVKNRGKGAPKKKRTAAGESFLLVFHFDFLGEKIGEGWDGEEKERAREADEIEVKYEDMGTCVLMSWWLRIETVQGCEEEEGGSDEHNGRDHLVMVYLLVCFVHVVWESRRLCIMQMD